MKLSPELELSVEATARELRYTPEELISRALEHYIEFHLYGPLGRPQTHFERMGELHKFFAS